MEIGTLCNVHNGLLSTDMDSIIFLDNYTCIFIILIKYITHPLETELRKQHEKGKIKSRSNKASKAEVDQRIRPLEAIKQLENDIQMLRFHFFNYYVNSNYSQARSKK